MTQLSTRDWESLSAYLDHQIEDRERSSLELRLKNEPDLSRALEELRITCQILNSCPKYRAPRNFTLTPQMAGKGQVEKSSFSLFPTLRLTAVLATLFFILISAGNLIVNPNGSKPMTVSESQYSSSQSSPLLGKGGGGGGAAPAPMLMPTAESFSLQAGESEDLSSESALIVTPEQSITPAEMSEQPMALSVPQGAETGLAKVGEEQPLNSESSEAEIQKTSGISISWINILQALLAILALGSGIAAIYTSKKRLD